MKAPQCIHPCVCVYYGVGGCHRCRASCKMDLLWSGAHRSSTSIHCTSEQTAKNIYHRGHTACTQHFKLTFTKTKYSGKSLTANLSDVVLSCYLSYPVVVHGSVETTAASFQVKFLCSVETQLQFMLIDNFLLTSVASLCFKCKGSCFHCPCYPHKHFQPH